jgi:hypothetical protein
MKTTSIHYNNDIHSKVPVGTTERRLFNAILMGNEMINLSVDDGDGDVWKYTIIVSSERVKSIVQIKEN